MNNPEEETRLTTLQRAIEARGWRWRPGKPIPYGVQFVVDNGDAQAMVAFYPKRGRIVVNGPDTSLRRALQELIDSLTPFPPSMPDQAQATIGLDESGKGDWFGPLVAAAVCVDPETAPALRHAGVRDSKRIAVGRIATVAAAIERLIPETARAVSVLDPVTYNQRYAELGNVSLVLAELFAATAAPVVARTGVTAIICDQFSQRADRLAEAFARARLPRPQQIPHAEEASLAVAAASVLATARFHEELARLGAMAGLTGPLPAGSSALALLEQTARRIIEREGAEGLGRYAKLHFQPLRRLLAELRPTPPPDRCGT